jgi:ABC-type nitrate/sulfonate/bicarbonate transport systems, periplasmic components
MSVTRLRLEYVHPWPNHAGLFLARARGLFAQRGLDVDLISDGTDRGDAATLLARGEYDVASLRLGQVLESRASGVPFVAVATLNQRQLGAVITTPATGITRFADLEGHSVAIPPVNRLVRALEQAVTADGGDFTQVTVADPGIWEPDIRSVEQGLYDAIINVRAWEPFQGNTPPEEAVVIDFDSVGVAPHHSYFLSVREETLGRNPEMVRAFLAGADAGYHATLDDEDAAVAAMSVPMCHIDPEVLRASVRAIRDSWFTVDGRWGEIQGDLVGSYTQWMLEGGFFDAPVGSAQGSWTNAFLV